MQLTCPHCRAAWEYGDRRPAFCPYCGKPLAADAATQPYPAPPTPGSEDATRPAIAPQPGGETADPDVVGGYRLLRVLGIGGMGKVYEAEDVTTGRRVALKLVSADYAQSADAVERFRQEGRLASLIAHPRCVFVLAADEEAGRPYIVMELMHGDTLDDHIRHWGALPQAKAVSLILDVIEGLQEAHRVGVIHRDVKPSNCFFGDDGRLKIGDFGLSKSLARGAHLTKTGSFLGTPLYASPEQVRGEALDAQTDVYSVAATLYYLLTGQAPFQSDNAAVTLARIAADPPSSMRKLNPKLSPTLDAVVLRGLERDRKRRWRNLEELADALRPFLRGRLSLARLGNRFAAATARFTALAVDVTLIWLLSVPLGMLLTALRWTKPLPNDWPEFDPALVLANLLLALLYFSVSEGVCGCSPGKWLLRLRVRDAVTGERVGWRRILGRTAFLVFLVKLGTLVSAFVLLPVYLSLPPVGQSTLAMDLYGLLLILPALGGFVSCLILGCNMRRVNGYRGLHEFISGTAVVPVPPPVPRLTVATTPASQALSRPRGVPEKIGTFEIRGAFRWDDDARILLAFDPVLGRQVVLWLRHRDEPTLTAARREVNRTTRLRWLAAGPFSSFQWDGFVAPGGNPLPALVAANGPMPWHQVQPFLLQLTDELLLALREGTMPKSLEPRLVWVRPDGQMVLADMPLTKNEATGAVSGPAVLPAEKPVPVEQALDLLARVSLVALEGAPPAEEMPSWVRAPLPLPAQATLRELLDYKKTELPLSRFRKHLGQLQDKPTEVTRARRAMQLALMALFLMLSLSFCFLYWHLVGEKPEDRQTQQAVALGDIALDDLNKASLGDFFCGALNPQPLPKIQAVAQLDADTRLCNELQTIVRRAQEKHTLRRRNSFVSQIVSGHWGDPPPQQYRSQQFAVLSAEVARTNARAALHRLHTRDPAAEEESETLGALYLLPAPALWVLWAFILPGGVSYRLAGIALVRGDGQPAGRLKAALRALLVWWPLGALLVASGLLADWYWSEWSTDAAPVWALSASTLVWWSVWLLVVLYAVLALRSPTRSPLDRLAGTYLVPR